MIRRKVAVGRLPRLYSFATQAGGIATYGVYYYEYDAKHAFWTVHGYWPAAAVSSVVAGKFAPMLAEGETHWRVQHPTITALGRAA